MNSLFMVTLLAARIVPAVPGEPLREPQIAVSGHTVALAFGAGNAIYFSASRDSGANFSKSVKVAESPIVPLTRHRGPRTVFAGSIIVITAVTGRKLAEGVHAHGLPSDGDLTEWRSADAGKSWSAGPAINDVPGAATEGLHALAANEKGELFAVWLDKRSGHGTQLYGAKSSDQGTSWTKNTLVYQSPEGTICECCHPSVVIGPAGEIFAMWRNWLGGSRDMYFTRSRDGVNFSRPERLGDGSWKLNACPMDGGGIVVSQGQPVTAWRREGDVFLASPGKPEKRVGTGKDVALAARGDRIYVAWSGPEGVTLWGDGKGRVLSPAGAFPALAVLPDGSAVAAWEENEGLQIQRVERQLREAN